MDIEIQIKVGTRTLSGNGNISWNKPAITRSIITFDKDELGAIQESLLQTSVMLKSAFKGNNGS